MSIIISASQPTFSYNVNPLLKISPLIDLYSNCLTHVMDVDGVLHFSAHKSPIIVSRKSRILNASSPSYQTSFAGVRSPRCLLTIAALFLLLRYDPVTLLNYMIPSSYNSVETPTMSTRNFARIYPQSFVIITDQSSRLIESNMENMPKKDCINKLSLFFALRLNRDLDSNPRISGEMVQKAFGLFAFNCSTYRSCVNKMEHLTRLAGKFVRASWQFYAFGRDDVGGADSHPFERGVTAGLEKSMYSFILGPRSQRVHLDGLCPPNFKRFQNDKFVAPKDIIPAGRSAAVKFVTTAGVFTPKSSYRVYFSPFFPSVWLCMFMCALITVTWIVGVYRMQSAPKEADIGVPMLIVEVATWVFAAALGQYKHSGIPLIPRQLCIAVTWILAPILVAWFILLTFLVNVYLAVFNADAAQSFKYRTRYANYMQLPPDTLTYILVNESYVRQYQAKYPIKDCSVGVKTKFCKFHRFAPAACNVQSTMYSVISRWMSTEKDKMKVATDPNWKQVHQHRQDKLLQRFNYQQKSSFLCANVESVRQISQQTKQPVAFLIGDHDFQKYWNLFVQVMQSNPNVKVANNFNSEEYLSQPVSYIFTSGLHPALKGLAVARMKTLLSSGIYGLWNKWYRIKLTDGGLQHDVKKIRLENRVDPLSFDNSGTTWVFVAVALAWFLATVMFTGEMIFRALRAYGLRRHHSRGVRHLDGLEVCIHLMSSESLQVYAGMFMQREDTHLPISVAASMQT